MMGNGVAGVLMMMVLAMACTVISGVGAAVFTVGDTSGWSVGSDYSTWASDKTFAVGDSLGTSIFSP